MRKRLKELKFGDKFRYAGDIFTMKENRKAVCIVKDKDNVLIPLQSKVMVELL